MRWFGPNDNMTLENIRQAGCSGVVSALHHIPYGEIWTTDEINKHKGTIESAGLKWSVIESLPVHEDIKKQSGLWKEYIANYKVSLENIAECGLKVVTYNFMPVFDWLRTNMAFKLADGSETLLFEKDAFAAFDIFLLERKDAKDDYTQQQIEQAQLWLDTHSQKEINQLSQNLFYPLPGTSEPLTKNEILKQLNYYKDIDRAQLKQHLFDFLNEIVPLAEELELLLAIHPDDPPYTVFGLPRIVSTSSDIDAILESVPSPSNGLCFCSGSLAAREDNDLLDMVDRFGDRIHFLHLRNTTRDEHGNFYEANHLSGDTDMFALVKALHQLMNRRGESIPMRPDHGHRILDDLNKQFYPGYSGIGRLRGLAELRGLELGLLRS